MKKKGRVGIAGLVLWGLVVFVVLGSVLVGCLPRPKEELPENGEKAVPVEVLEVTTRGASRVLQLPGRVAAFYDARLAVEAPGRITELAVDRGDRVTAGQVLLRVDSRIPQAVLVQATAEARDAKQELVRYQELKGTGAVSDSDFDRIRKAWELSAAAATAASVQVQKCKIVAPTDGVIEDRYVEAGEYATEGMAVLRLVRTDPVKVVFDAPEREIGAVREGSVLSFVVATIPGAEFEAKVSFVAAVAAPENNAFRTEMLIDNPEGQLKPGMITDIELVSGTYTDAVVVPRIAVIPKRGEHAVFVIENDRAVRRLVHVHSYAGPDVILTSGVDVGDKVVVLGQRTLQDGALVEIREPETDSGAEL